MKLFFVVAAAVLAPSAFAASFVTDVKPIIEGSCLSCHGEKEQKGGLRLDTRAAALKGGDGGPSLVPGKSAESSFYKLIILPEGHDDIMPPKGEALTKAQTDRIKQWIDEGAVWGDEIKLTQTPRIQFKKDVQLILEMNCVSCHRDENDKGGLNLANRTAAFKGGDAGPSIVAGLPDKSSLYTLSILPRDHEDVMPPKDRDGLSKEEQEILRLWILQGAPWSTEETLAARKKVIADSPERDLQIVTEIHKGIVAKNAVKTEAEMKPYKHLIAGTEVSFEMVPIPGGKFVMGSPQNEPGRNADEGPQHQVKVDPFWMGKCEITWDEFELFMYPENEKRLVALSAEANTAINEQADAVSRPTKPYVEMSFGYGKDGFPAISMTHHAAMSYCKWLSARTGQFYRLPTEAEWEYACRAGSTTAYHFGDDISKIGDYAWYEDNSEWKYQKVGKKKPNAWGLHDMHGNVAEWTLDEHRPDYTSVAKDVLNLNPWAVATQTYPHSVRGGSWDDKPDKLRSSARRASNKSWKRQDPQLPKSIWYLTDAQFLGFRIVRPLAVPATPQELSKYWTGNPRE